MIILYHRVEGEPSNKTLVLLVKKYAFLVLRSLARFVDIVS